MAYLPDAPLSLHRRLGFGIRAAVLLVFVLVITLAIVYASFRWSNLVLIGYYGRVFLLASLVLVGLPFAVHFIPALRSMLGNLFIVMGRLQLGFVLAAIFSCGMAIALMADAFIQTGPVRFSFAVSDKVLNYFGLKQYGPYVMSLLLGTPMAVYTVVKTRRAYLESEHTRPATWIAWGVVFGLAATVGVALMGQTFSAILGIAQMNINSDIIPSFLNRDAVLPFLKGYIGDNIKYHVRTTGFLITGFILYLFIGIAFHPKPGKTVLRIQLALRRAMNRVWGNKEEEIHWRPLQTSALFYVLVLFTGFTLFLSGATYLLDYVRIPALFAVVIFSMVMSRLAGSRNIYPVSFVNEALPDPDEALLESLNNRLKWQDTAGYDGRTLVVVCLGGGGIQAAGWAATVLKGLQEDPRLGTDFARSIGMLNGVSGGAVGAMHYLNWCRHQGIPAPDDLPKLFKDATSDSLDTTVWGILFIDFWRLLGLPFLVFRQRDRGWAVEQDWKAILGDPMKDKCLSDLRKEVMAGDLPISVFNTTVSGAGTPLLMSPLALPLSSQKVQGAANFVTHFRQETNRGPHYADTRLTTAARLSAAFPYVSPISCNDQGTPVIHLADGGYFDNHALFAGIELVEWLSNQGKEKSGIDKVMFVRVVAFPEKEQEQKKINNWMRSLTGPIRTVLATRSSSQSTHLTKELELLQELLAEREGEGAIDVAAYTLTYPGPAAAAEHDEADGIPEDPPLSWRLSPAQKNALLNGWQMPAVQKEVDAIAQQWKSWNQSSLGKLADKLNVSNN